MTLQLHILIPTYNDKDTLPSVVARLATFELPVLIVDDGSAADAAQVLDTLASAHPFVTLLRRPVNGGKGMAVRDGIADLHARGATHALQIDADDQHCLDDIPRFVAAARSNPNALVLGTPVFGGDAPRGRVIGRNISRFWVALETLSRAIHDPLFGYRVYPVADTFALQQRVRIGARMDFDPEIAVRLYWRGLDVINIPSQVRYPEGGVSRFRMFRDNARISWMHTRLFIGMLFRLPRLVARHFK
ncbi:MAG: glycosyltransferase family 2 protein [Proteobacteria bacterium]|nr:glycosyltransferase family 2 protein [Pseudomonadota bacterium]